MATLVLKDFLQARYFVYQQVRFNLVNVQRPLPTHFEKQKFLKLTVPYYEKDDRPLADKCLKRFDAAVEKELTPLDHIYAKEVRHWFRKCKVSAVFARNPMSCEDFHLVKVQLFKANMKLVIRNRRIMKQALDGTEFVNLLPLFDTHNMIVFSDETNIAELFRLSKKEPRVTLLGAVVDNQILCVSQLQKLAEIGDIQSARSQLVQTMLSSGQGIHRGLEAHQNMLLHHLQQRVEQLKESPPLNAENS